MAFSQDLSTVCATSAKLGGGVNSQTGKSTSPHDWSVSQEYFPLMHFRQLFHICTLLFELYSCGPSSPSSIWLTVSRGLPRMSPVLRQVSSCYKECFLSLLFGSGSEFWRPVSSHCIAWTQRPDITVDMLLRGGGMCD